jgi:hypothetical protein
MKIFSAFIVTVIAIHDPWILLEIPTALGIAVMVTNKIYPYPLWKQQNGSSIYMQI